MNRLLSTRVFSQATWGTRTRSHSARLGTLAAAWPHCSLRLGRVLLCPARPDVNLTSYLAVSSTKHYFNRSRNQYASFHTSGQTAAHAKKWSYIHGPSSVPLLGTTIGKRLQEKVEAHPDKTAVIFFKDGITLTFAELLEKVNINPSYRPIELEYALRKSGCKLLVASTGFKNLDYFKMLSEIMPELQQLPVGAAIKSEKLPALQYVVMMDSDKYPGTLRFEDVMESSTPSHRQSVLDLQDQLQFDDPINIQFTSGTTGSPKGATLSHHNIVNNSYFLGLRCGYHEHEAVICAPIPLYHCFGMVMASLQMITHGATLVWPSPVFDPLYVLKAVEEHKCTSLYGVPTMFIDILNHPLCSKTDTSSLITGIMAGAPCPVETVKAVLQRMNMHKFTVCYGSTETSPVSFQSTGGCTLDKRVSTVGKVLDHVEGKVVDLDGRIVPLGSVGELCTRGPNNMLGYWEDPEKTGQAITPDRWYHTGDLAVMTEDGYCSIVGRIKDMLIRGGENIYPLEIEQALYKHPKIKDVQVIGTPDVRLGEQVCAWIVVKDGMTLTEQEVRDFCKDKMARFKIPHYILFVEGFPTTVTGKIQKYVMREETIKKLRLSQS
ncbi:hypothetical protein BsWGS_18002 [Bradybaena similaris]